jgi:hypothetical protein
VTVFKRPAGNVACNLGDAVVIEPNRPATWLKKDGHPVSHYHGVGMIDFKTMTTDKFHDEWLERRALL